MAKLIEIPMSDAEAARLEPVRFATPCSRKRGPRRGQVRLPDGTLMGLGELEKRLDRAGRELGRSLAFYRALVEVLVEFVQAGHLDMAVARGTLQRIEPRIREIIEGLRKYPVAQAEITEMERRLENGIGVLPAIVTAILWVVGAIGTVGGVALVLWPNSDAKERRKTQEDFFGEGGTPAQWAEIESRAKERDRETGGLTGLGEDALGLVKNLAFAGLFGWFFLKILAPRLAKGATKMGEKLGDWGDSLQERGEKSIAKQRSVLS